MRIFGKKGELFIWRDSDRLRGRAIFDESEQLPPYCQTETHILWGTNGQPENGFTILTDGSQRLLHAFPLLVPQEAFGPFRRPTQLLLRHYVTRHEETGMARITMSRLYDLDYEKPKKKEGKNGSQA
ncbi:MAG: CRISPR-associated protein Csx19, partial [Anaerolineae bacterium]